MSTRNGLKKEKQKKMIYLKIRFNTNFKKSIMEEKKFNCKMEDVPVITGFALESLEKDLEVFENFSPIFTLQFISNARAKQSTCYDLTKTNDVLKLQKVITKSIIDKVGMLRLSLNQLEGYLKLANAELDIKVSDFGLKNIRTAISKTNVEGIISDTRSLISILKRNEAVLQEKGMKTEFLTVLTALVLEIETLNTQQNSKKNERSRVSGINNKVFNELWDTLGTIIDAGHAIYRGVDEVKLKEYTLTNLLKRVHSENGTSPNPPETTKPSS